MARLSALGSGRDRRGVTSRPDVPRGSRHRKTLVRQSTIDPRFPRLFDRGPLSLLAFTEIHNMAQAVVTISGRAPSHLGATVKQYLRDNPLA